MSGRTRCSLALNVFALGFLVTLFRRCALLYQTSFQFKRAVGVLEFVEQLKPLKYFHIVVGCTFWSIATRDDGVVLWRGFPEALVECLDVVLHSVSLRLISELKL